MRTLGGGVTDMPQGTPQSRFARQLPAGNPVAALTVHRTVIHYRDCALLTPSGEPKDGFSLDSSPEGEPKERILPLRFAQGQNDTERLQTTVSF